MTGKQQSAAERCAALEKRRLKAAALFNKGVPQQEIAEKLGVTQSAVSLWYKAWKKKGKKGLQSKGIPGFQSAYTETKKAKLKAIILKGPHAAGYTTDFWTLERIRSVAKKKLGVDLGIKRTWVIVCELGFSIQKPERRAKERDEVAIRHWQETTFPDLKKMGAKTWVFTGIPR